MKKKLLYLFSKINWSTSALDAKAVDIMNTIVNDVDELEKVNVQLTSALEGEVLKVVRAEAEMNNIEAKLTLEFKKTKKLREKIRLAECIIQPAIEILPESYNKEIKNFESYKIK